jgi:2'-5' RNA ligase
MALTLPELQRHQLQRLQQALGIGRHLPPENLHLTVAFLGDQTDAVMDEVHLSMQDLRASRPEVVIAGVDVFGAPDAPRLVFAGVRDSRPLTDLHKRVRARLHAAGLDLRRERYRPHVTLARLGANPAPDELARLGRFISGYSTFAADAFVPAGVTLYESVRGKTGTSYHALADYPLG